MKYGCQSMVGKMNAVLLKHPKDAFISQEHLNKYSAEYNYIGIPDYEKAVEEYTVFEKIIKEHVPEVYYLPQDDRAGLDSIFAHDSLKVTKHGAIYFNMSKEGRKGESEAAEDYLKSIGIPTLGRIEAPGRMEGGDVVWLDERTAAIGMGYRTNAEGIRQFKELTKDFVDEVIAVPLPHGNGEDECLHLMSLISMVDQDLAVVYSRYMPVFFRDILLERGMKLLEVNDEEYDYLGENVLALAPRVCVLIKGVPEITRKLKDNGCTVYTYPGEEVSFKETGGATCYTHPLQRDDVK